VAGGAAPPQRYGVSGPPGAPRATILILTGSGETAEAWFETVKDLNGRGHTVWILERLGQGGSGRYARPRELIHARSFDPDVAAVEAMAREVIRPSPETPFVVLAEAQGGLVALQALKGGLRVDGLILSDVEFKSARTPSFMERLAVSLGMGQMAAPGYRPWRREQSTIRLVGDRWRRGVQHAWQVANPDLRMAGPSLAWLRAEGAAEAEAERALPASETPMAVLGAGEKVVAGCRSAVRCRAMTFPEAKGPLYLERDVVRDRWMGEINSFVDELVFKHSDAPSK
jgi:lysophospholipase